MKTGIELIANERQEQIEKQGHTVNNDLTYRSNILARAACAIAYEGIKGGVVTMDAPVWAWAIRNRPGIDMVNRLTIAGTLIAAEIDRLNNSK